MSREEVRVLAVQHANNLRADIENAQTRIEHIRLTRLAEEAAALVAAIDAPDIVSPQYLPTHL